MKSTRHPHLIPDINNWPIRKLALDRKKYVDEIVEEASSYLTQTQDDLLRILTRTYEMEQKRIKSDPWKVDPPNQQIYWNKIRKRISAVEALPPDNLTRIEESLSILHSIIRLYAEEIVGDFRVGTFKFARVYSHIFFRILFNRFFSRPLGFWGKRSSLDERVLIKGEVERVRTLFDKGTIIFVPTHSSNLDSLFIGFAVDEFMGLPGFNYGAGLNLYNGELVAYLMNRLGAYRVDRRKKNPIYLETLKSTSRLAIYRGVNSLFFPEGTRSRSGGIEKHLKLGLLGTAMQAQRKLYQHDINNKVIIVPLTLNYHNVLEANDLVESYIRGSGVLGLMRRKIKRPGMIKKTLGTLKHFLKSGMTVYITVGSPMDILGNKLDEQGNSLDDTGESLDIREYFVHDQEINTDSQRENIYTQHLSDKIYKSFQKHLVIFESTLCARAFLEASIQAFKLSSALEVLRLDTNDLCFPLDSYKEVLKKSYKYYRQLSQEGQCETSGWENRSIQEIIEKGMDQINVYHNYSVLKIKGDMICTYNSGLIVYYSNRLNIFEKLD
jgi:glycerol-3-phosphate O-acyltransferase